MAANTRIAWCDYTFNPWLGCLCVSPACDNCYAAAMAKRTGRRDPAGHDLWDPHAERRRTSPANWRQPRRWNRDALAEGRRQRVFCASMADIFDNRAPAAWRADLWDLIRATPALDWLLLTKRPQNIAAMLPPDWGSGWPNVWLGATVENRAEAARRLPHLTQIAARVRFVSAEPMLEGIDLSIWLAPACARGIDWVIAGGESGRGNRSRPMRPEWVRDLRDQVQRAGAALFVKQVGSNRTAWPGVKHFRGEDPAEWPADLRVREFPQSNDAPP